MAPARSTWPNKQRGGYSPRWVCGGWVLWELGNFASGSARSGRRGGRFGAGCDRLGGAAGLVSAAQCFQALSGWARGFLARFFSPEASQGQETAVRRLIACFATLRALGLRLGLAEGGVVPPFARALAPHARRVGATGDLENPARVAPVLADRGRGSRIAKIQSGNSGSGVWGASSAPKIASESADFRRFGAVVNRGRGWFGRSVHDLLIGAGIGKLGGGLA